MSARAEFLAVQSAYRTLSNPDARCEYDGSTASAVFETSHQKICIR